MSTHQAENERATAKQQEFVQAAMEELRAHEIDLQQARGETGATQKKAEM